MQANKQKKIIIIDDEKDSAETAAWDLEEAGYEPILIVDGSFNGIDELISRIPDDTNAVVCDQRLRKSGFATFNGSDLIAVLYDRKIPAILNTQYFDIDDVPIRKHRHKIPVLLSKQYDVLDENTVEVGISKCLDEFEGRFSNERKPHRNIIRVIDYDKKYKEEVVDVIIPSWKPNIPVPLPLAWLSWDRVESCIVVYPFE
jgi:CheY-like chemotaxis protein